METGFPSQNALPNGSKNPVNKAILLLLFPSGWQNKKRIGFPRKPFSLQGWLRLIRIISVQHSSRDYLLVNRTDNDLSIQWSEIQANLEF